MFFHFLLEKLWNTFIALIVLFTIRVKYLYNEKNVWRLRDFSIAYSELSDQSMMCQNPFLLDGALSKQKNDHSGIFHWNFPNLTLICFFLCDDQTVLLLPNLSSHAKSKYISISDSIYSISDNFSDLLSETREPLKNYFFYLSYFW